MASPRLVAPLKQVLNAADYQLGRARLSLFGDRPGLLCLAFHAIMEDGASDEIDRVVDPTQTVSISSLDLIIRHFKECNYSFVSPTEIIRGLRPEGRHILVTFDDGYWNNVRVLPILNFHKVPAVFFVTTNHVRTGRAFWWDVIYRERLARGTRLADIRAEQGGLKRSTHDTIESYLMREFGEAALQPVGNEDRPMTPDELRDLSRLPFVHIGNHTHNHGILTNYSYDGMLSQISLAQDAIVEWTGQRPRAIAYPNGDSPPEIYRAAAELELDLGLTLQPCRNRNAVPDPFDIGRYCPTRTHENPRDFIEFRTGFSLRRAVARSVRSWPSRFRTV